MATSINPPSLTSSSVAPSPAPAPTSPSPLILGLSGPSSSGKTTIATSLLSIFPSSSLIHADDFYKPESSLPFRAGYRDWDCAESLDLDALCSTLADWKVGREIPVRKRQGVLPETTSEDDALAKRTRVLRDEVVALGPSRRLLIIDGFLLFPPSLVGSEIPSHLNIKILLRASRAAAKERRESRAGYVTLDGFWKDPPGYFDDLVWPNYVEGHAQYFLDGDVDGSADEERCKAEGVRVGPLEEGIEGVLEWVVGVVKVFHGKAYDEVAG